MLLPRRWRGGEENNKYKSVEHQEDPEGFPIYTNWSIKISVKVEVKVDSSKHLFRIAQLSLKKNTVIQTISGKLYYKELINPETIGLSEDMIVSVQDIYYQPNTKTIIIRCNLTTEKLEAYEGLEVVKEGNSVLYQLMDGNYSIFMNKAEDHPTILFTTP